MRPESERKTEEVRASLTLLSLAERAKKQREAMRSVVPMRFFRKSHDSLSRWGEKAMAKVPTAGASRLLNSNLNRQ